MARAEFTVVIVVPALVVRRGPAPDSESALRRR